MLSRFRMACLVAAFAAGGAARADTIQASSTTMLLGRQDFRLPLSPTQDVTLQTAVPLYEILDLAASDVRTPYGNLELVLSTWGSLDLADRRFWENGAIVHTSYSGDVNVGFVRGEFLDRHLSLRVGRAMVAEGIARMIQLDGAELKLAIPGNFGLQAYVGQPVAPRFTGRGGELAVGNIRANFATGGRLSWRYSTYLDLGASVQIANDRGGEASRRDVGADVRITPADFLVLTGEGFFNTSESRIGEAIAMATFTPVRHLDITADYRHVEPDLFLPRTSILSVFTAEKRNDVGGSVHWGGLRYLALDGDYHLMIEDEGHGHWARAKATAHPGGAATTIGIEGSLLKHPENGYKLARLFAGRTWNAITGTIDLYAYFFDVDVNGQPRSLQATATLAYEFLRGWKAALAGTAGTTPYLEHQFEIMAKLVYEQTYAVREVR